MTAKLKNEKLRATRCRRHTCLFIILNKTIIQRKSLTWWNKPIACYGSLYNNSLHLASLILVLQVKL